MPFLFVAGFLCAAPLQINKTKFEWNDVDNQQIALSRRRCIEKYGERSPCLRKLVKTGERDYYAECGAALKEQNKL